MESDIEFFTFGYLRWPTATRWQRLAQSCTEAGIDILVDIRHSPCASSLMPASNYGPRPWHLQAGQQGIARGLREVGVDYLWLGELGNPQKNDPKMLVLREHLADPGVAWPVQRGLDLLESLVAQQHKRVCLMCACKDLVGCHRQLISDAIVARLTSPPMSIRVLSRELAPPKRRCPARSDSPKT